MGNNPKVWLNLNEKEFEDSKKRAKEDSILSDQNDPDMKDYLLYPNAFLQLDELNLDDKSDTINLYGSLQTENFELGTIGIDIPITQDMAIQIVDRFMKKLGKLKTVLEATKD